MYLSDHRLYFQSPYELSEVEKLVCSSKETVFYPFYKRVFVFTILKVSGKTLEEIQGY